MLTSTSSSPQRTRRIVKQQAIPHDRILELAMESRGARIERERLQRQSHLVRAREEALSNEVKKTENTLVSVRSFVLVDILDLNAPFSLRGLMLSFPPRATAGGFGFFCFC